MVQLTDVVLMAWTTIEANGTEDIQSWALQEVKINMFGCCGVCDIVLNVEYNLYDMLQ